MTDTFQKYGWKPDLPDHRDLLLHEMSHVERLVLPEALDLRHGYHWPACYDQNQLGSCTANAIAAAMEFEQIKKGTHNPVMPSRLMIYYDERAMEGSIQSDAGAMIRDGVKTVTKQGACPETQWPYHIDAFKQKPSVECYSNVMRASGYRAVQVNLAAMRAAICARYPIIVGFSVYSSFETDEVARTGVVPLPDKSEQLLGGHAVLVVGYDDKTQRFTCRNSWRSSWGDHGYFTIPYAYLTDTNLADDFWTLQA